MAIDPAAPVDTTRALFRRGTSNAIVPPWGVASLARLGIPENTVGRVRRNDHGNARRTTMDPRKYRDVRVPLR
ncbi:hypothetical protein BLA13014_06271 [Burkholderia aenigmatica]|uniref:Uncharacterized protein n=1 Tax=Burkholderia aenigmatica TaxID=2015348 RepID=A0A6P2RG58_9BURK|nr:hypothetical protein [Burkholderia aenigmatica]VWC31192.1 hypothetical protein BLA13014_06271 [Burkholderia aenigmatica]